MGQKTSPLSLREQYRYNIWGESNFSFIEAYKLREYILYYFSKKGLLVNLLTVKKEGNTLYLEIDFIISRSSRLYSRRYRRVFMRKRTTRTQYVKGRRIRRVRLRSAKRRLRVLKYRLKKRILVFSQRKRNKMTMVQSDWARSVRRRHLERNAAVSKRRQVPRFDQQGLHSFLQLLCKLYNVGRVHFSAKRLERRLNLNLLKQMHKVAATLSYLKYNTDKDLQDLLLLGTLLLKSGDIKAETLNRVIRKYFTWLPKRAHKSFGGFIRDFFQKLYELDQKHNQVLLGIKFRISGRLQGKPRAQSMESIAGRISLQSLGVNVEYSKLTSYSRLGTFGCKLWIAKKN